MYNAIYFLYFTANVVLKFSHTFCLFDNFCTKVLLIDIDFLM